MLHDFTLIDTGPDGGYIVPVSDILFPAHANSFLAVLCRIGRGKEKHWGAVETVFRFMWGVRYAT